MRLLVRVAAAMASMRAPLKPLRANSAVATVKISAWVPAGSLVRLLWRGAFEGSTGLGLAGAVAGMKCTNWFICKYTQAITLLTRKPRRCEK